MPERLNDYFAREAREYLDQLESLLDLPGTPEADHLLRLATGVRGSAQMAQAETVAGVAERLEDAARAMLTNDVAWSEELRSLSSRTVADLKLLLRNLSRWGPEEEERVRLALNRWDSEEGGAQALPRLTVSSTPEAVPIATLFFDDEGPHTFPPDEKAATASLATQKSPTADSHLEAEAERDASEPGAGHLPPETAEASSEEDREVGVVPIADLLLRGEAALLEAIALRPTFERFARGDAVPDQSLADLVQELFDLVEQAVMPEHRGV